MPRVFVAPLRKLKPAPVIFLVAISLWLPTAATAQTLPKPNPFQQREMNAKGITYNEWLLTQGIRKRDLELVSYALRAGANPNKAAPGAMPPIFIAVGTPRAVPDVVSLLIKHGADVNIRYDLPPPDCKNPEFSWMQRRNCEEVAKTVLKGYFPLYHAAAFGNIRVVDLLIENRADVRARLSNGATALFGTYDVEIGKALLGRGVDVNAKDQNGETVLRRTKRFLSQLDPKHDKRPKVEAFHAWLVSLGAIE